MVNLALKNVVHDKRRLLTALAGTGFAVVLMFMQVGLYRSVEQASTLVYDALAFDAAVVSTDYSHLRIAGRVPRGLVGEARGVAGVASAAPVGLGAGRWRVEATGKEYDVVLVGVRPDDRPFRGAAANALVPLLSRPGAALAGRHAHPRFGPHGAGDSAEVNGRRVRVVGDYDNGYDFISGATLVVSDRTLAELYGTGAVSAVLLRFEPAADPAAVLANVRAAIPDAAAVWTRDELLRHERNFVLNVKPVGFMFTSGALIGFVVGAVILYQTLSTDIARQVRQFATLKAVGYGRGALYAVVMRQGAYYALFSFVPGLALSAGLYALIRELAGLGMPLTWGSGLSVFGLTLGMCVLSGVLALRKFERVDPAELF